MNWYYHSRDPRHKSPFGAVRTNETVSFRVDGVPSAMAELLLYLPDGPKTVPMEWDGASYRASFTAPNTPCRMGYGFRIDGRYFGAESGEARFSDAPQTYGLTVYDGAFETPEWFRHAVVYQIFPDRFFCADRKRFLNAAADYRAAGRPIFTHASWDEKPFYLPHGGAKEYVPDDYFGGDLSGIREKLPYIASLGVTCIYLNPIFAAHSNHRYNTADYLSIDPLLGTNADFTALCEAAKAFGIRIVLDGVFSHTGDDSVYFDRYHRYKTHGACESKDSPYYPWYRFYEYPNTYECWWNFDTLPDVEENEPSYTEFIQGENGVLKTWLKNGASGWRLDVADELPDSFIRGVRRSIKSFDPDAVLIGEVWEDPTNKVAYGEMRCYCQGDTLDSVMNYPLRTAVLDFVHGRMDAYALRDFLIGQQMNYPKPLYYSLMNLLGSHDVPRLKNSLAVPQDLRALSRAEQLLIDFTPADLRRAVTLEKLCAVLQFSLPGVPSIYYGDEQGMEGVGDPFNRLPFREGDGELFAHYAKLCALRASAPALSTGEAKFYAESGDVLVVLRYITDGRDVFGDSAENGVYLCVLTRGVGPRAYSVDCSAAGLGVYSGTAAPESGEIIRLR